MLSIGVCYWFCYQTKLGSTCPMHSKDNLLTPGCDEGKCGIYSKVPNVAPNKENRRLRLNRPELSDGFQGRVFKGNIRGKDVMCQMSLCTSFWIGWRWGNRVVFGESTSSTIKFQPVWGLWACGQHAVNFFHLVGFSVSAKQLKDIYGLEYYL